MIRPFFSSDDFWKVKFLYLGKYKNTSFRSLVEDLYFIVRIIVTSFKLSNRYRWMLDFNIWKSNSLVSCPTDLNHISGECCLFFIQRFWLILTNSDNNSENWFHRKYLEKWSGNINVNSVTFIDEDVFIWSIWLILVRWNHFLCFYTLHFTNLRQTPYSTLLQRRCEYFGQRPLVHNTSFQL